MTLRSDVRFSAWEDACNCTAWELQGKRLPGPTGPHRSGAGDEHSMAEEADPDNTFAVGLLWWLGGGRASDVSML